MGTISKWLSWFGGAGALPSFACVGVTFIYAYFLHQAILGVVLGGMIAGLVGNSVQTSNKKRKKQTKSHR